ncbi:MAG: porphobilinogen deaminase [Saprospiraceae bacterium]|nr:MAG: porphobilinogen deaminase [Saprospiraceae bacterium]
MIIGTRGSKLALWQANFTQARLEEVGVNVELQIIKTQGDRIQHLTFDKLEGKGFFTKEIEDALLAGEIQLAVHSMKDLPTTSPEGLVITAVSYRENPADWMLIRTDMLEKGALFQLKKNAVVGTSSARRKAQLLDYRPDVQIKDIRGNVPTRINKLRNGDFDAIMLAAAGLSRLELDLSEFHVVKFNPKEFVPAPAQGVLAFQTKAEDLPTRRILKQIHQAEVAEVTNIERKVLNLLDGGCQLPLGVYCEKDSQGNFHIWAASAKTWDAPVKRVNLSSSTSFELAERVVEALKEV